MVSFLPRGVQCFSKGTFQTVDVRKVDEIRADAPQELYTLVYPNLLVNRCADTL